VERLNNFMDGIERWPWWTHFTIVWPIVVLTLPIYIVKAIWDASWSERFFYAAVVAIGAVFNLFLGMGGPYDGP